MKTTEQIETVLASAGAHTLGAIVFWSLANARILREDLKTKLEELGLEEAMPREVTPKGALGKAVQSVFSGRKSVLARKLARGWALVAERRDSDGVVELEHLVTVSIQEGSLVFQPIPGTTLTFAGVGHPGILTDIESAYDVALRYVLTSDLSELLTESLTGNPHRGLMGGLSLRERTGGLYFVNAVQVERMARLKAAVEALAPDCQVSLLTLTGDAENLQQAARVAKSTFLAQLNTLKTELREFQSKLESDDKEASAYSIKVRAERFRDLNGRVELFRDILGTVATDLQSQIEATRVELLGKIEGL